MEFILERTDILDMKGSLKLFGMRTASDEIITTTVKRRTSRSVSSAIYSRQRSTRSSRDPSSTR